MWGCATPPKVKNDSLLRPTMYVHYRPTSPAGAESNEALCVRIGLYVLYNSVYSNIIVTSRSSISLRTR